ncbi:MAG: LytR C-terminal domain-containing protein [candidate division WOR-3 bacterium]
MSKIKTVFLVILLLLLIVAISSILIRYVPIFKPKPKPIAIEPGQIRLEIINASGIDRQGKRAMAYLRKIGFDVYGVRNAQKEIERTTIVDRLDKDMKYAKATAEFFKQKRRIIFFLPQYREIMPVISCDLDSTLYLEVSVILGKDCQLFIPKDLIAF